MDQGYVGENEGKRLIDDFKKLSIMINNFMEHLKGSRYKGAKYKMPERKSTKATLDEIMKKINAKKDPAV